MLETVTDVEPESLVMDGDFKNNIHNLFQTHQQYLTNKQQTIIAGVYARELFTYSYNNEDVTGLLTYEELEQLLQDEIGFGKLDETFTYSKPEQPDPIRETNKRRVGVLFIKIKPVPPASDRIHTALKELNWRQDKTDASVLVFYRKGSVVFGIPTISTIEDTFREKLLKLRTTYPNVELTYQEDETGIIYTL